MNDDLMKRISDAFDSDGGLTSDPEVARALAEDPAASVYAKQLARVNTWLATSDMDEPSALDMEELAARIEQRLDEELPELDVLASPFPDGDGADHIDGDAVPLLTRRSDAAKLVIPALVEPTIELAPAPKQSKRASVARLVLDKKVRSGAVEESIVSRIPDARRDDHDDVEIETVPRVVDEPKVIVDPSVYPPAPERSSGEGLELTPSAIIEVSPLDGAPVTSAVAPSVPSAPTSSTAGSIAPADAAKAPRLSTRPVQVPKPASIAPPADVSAGQVTASSAVSPGSAAAKPDAARSDAGALAGAKADAGKAAPPPPPTSKSTEARPPLRAVAGGATPSPAREQPRQEKKNSPPSMLPFWGGLALAASALLAVFATRSNESPAAEAAPAMGAAEPLAFGAGEHGFADGVAAAPSAAAPSAAAPSGPVQQVAPNAIAFAPPPAPVRSLPAVLVPAPEGSAAVDPDVVAEVAPGDIVRARRGGSASGNYAGLTDDFAEANRDESVRSGRVPAAELPTPSSAPATAALDRRAEEDENSLGSLALRRASGGGGGGVSAAPASAPASAGASSGGRPAPAPVARSATTATVTREVERPAEARAEAAAAPAPDLLDPAAVRAVFAGLDPRVRACAGALAGTTVVDAVISSSGRVSSVEVSGTLRGTPEGTCVARVIRAAMFPASQQDRVAVRYSYAH